MKYLIYLLVIPILFISCQPKEEKTTPVPTLGKYIYRDDNDIHHINPICLKLIHGKDDAGHTIYAKHPIDTSDFRIEKTEYFRVCAICVNDMIYERLLNISRHNTQIAARHWLYAKLVKDYEMPSYEEYDSIMAHECGIRIKLYDIASQEGWNVGSSFSEFEEALGYSEITKLHHRTSKGRGY